MHVYVVIWMFQFFKNSSWIELEIGTAAGFEAQLATLHKQHAQEEHMRQTDAATQVRVCLCALL